MRPKSPALEDGANEQLLPRVMSFAKAPRSKRSLRRLALVSAIIGAIVLAGMWMLSSSSEQVSEPDSIAQSDAASAHVNLPRAEAGSTYAASTSASFTSSIQPTTAPSLKQSSTPLKKPKIAVKKPPASPLVEARFDRLAVIVKSGRDVVLERFPPQYDAWLSRVRNLVLVGDANMTNVGRTGMNMLDVVSLGLNIVDPVAAMRHRVKYGNTVASLPAPLTKNGTKAAGVTTTGKNDAAAATIASKVNMTMTRVEDSEGWQLDTHKFLPAVGVAAERFPDAEWFILADDDVHIFLDNVLAAVHKHDSSKPFYFGSGNYFAGCAGVRNLGDGPPFAHGGAGIILSRGAVLAMMPALYSCIKTTADCWAGDVRLALCLNKVGVRLTSIGDQYRFLEERPGSAKWTFRADDKCKRPISLHHIKPNEYAAIRHAEQLAHAAALSEASIWLRTSPATHPYLYTWSSEGALVGHAKTQATFAPVTLADILTEYAQHLDFHAGRDANRARPNAEAVLATVDVATEAQCRQRCLADGACLSWDYEAEARKCRLLHDIPTSVPAIGTSTGIFPHRYTCPQREL